MYVCGLGICTLYIAIFCTSAGSFILTRQFPYPSDYGRQAGSGPPSSMVRENMRSEDDDLFFPTFSDTLLFISVFLICTSTSFFTLSFSSSSRVSPSLWLLLSLRSLLSPLSEYGFGGAAQASAHTIVEGLASAAAASRSLYSPADDAGGEASTRRSSSSANLDFDEDASSRPLEDAALL